MVLGLSQNAYMQTTLKKFSMHVCTCSSAPIVKGDKLGKYQCPKNHNGIDQMKSYASIVKSMIYAQVYTRSDLIFIIGMLCKF